MPRHAHVSIASELSNEDLEHYLLGHIREEAELIQVEKHLVACPKCAQRAAAMADYITTMREALRQVEKEAGVLPYNPRVRVGHRELLAWSRHRQNGPRQ